MIQHFISTISAESSKAVKCTPNFIPKQEFADPNMPKGQAMEWWEDDFDKNALEVSKITLFFKCIAKTEYGAKVLLEHGLLQTITNAQCFVLVCVERNP